ncbi:MAG: hypothetical protein ACRDRA_12400 [Pseudonocardiaceae bacterium]
MEDPAELLGLLARISRQARERCGDIVTILRSGAALDPDIAATLSEGLRRNRLGVEVIVERIRGTGCRIDARAADIAVAMMSAEVYDRLVVDAGWSPGDYEVWLKRTLVTALLH